MKGNRSVSFHFVGGRGKGKVFPFFKWDTHKNGRQAAGEQILLRAKGNLPSLLITVFAPLPTKTK